eukprot:131879-Pyramimonas_sp.AAC.1
MATTFGHTGNSKTQGAAVIRRRRLRTSFRNTHGEQDRAKRSARPTDSPEAATEMSHESGC